MSDIRFNSGALEALLKSSSGAVAKEVLQVGLRVERMAKQLAPVDTGRLRASIRTELRGDAQGPYAVVGTNVHYAIYQEFGTRFMPAHPFLRPAIFGVLGSPP